MSPAIPKSWPSLYHRRRAVPSGDDGPAVWSLVRAQLELAHNLHINYGDPLNDDFEFNEWFERAAQAGPLPEHRASTSHGKNTSQWTWKNGSLG
jgi:hypothetical protein